MLHVIAAVEMEIDVHVIVLRQRKDTPNLRGAIFVIADAAAHHRGAPLQTGD
jgi:hypothetical protein